LRSAALVFAFALACYLPLLGRAPLEGTEAHRALTAHQMVQSGQWLVPRLYDQIYLAKPPLHYWILASVEKLSGQATPLIWRLPAAFEGAILAAVLCLFGGRWFGKTGGLVSGFSYVALVTMWGENRGAELDASNTLPAALAALCLLELHFGQPRRRAVWVLGAGLFTAATLMAKGPAGLTIILGVFIWAGIAAVRRREGRWFIQPSTWLPLAMGAVVFGVYSYAVYLFLRSHHLFLDYSGVIEGAQGLHPSTWWSIAMALLLPPTVFIFALPVSLALPMAWIMRDDEPARERLTHALIASVLLAWGISLASGMTTPRYAFVTLPLLCPLAGAIAARVAALGRLPRGAAPAVPTQSYQWLNAVRGILIGSAIAFWIGAMVLAVMLRKGPAVTELVVVVGLSTWVAAVTVSLLLRRGSWRGAWGFLPLIWLMSIPFAILKNNERFQKSGREQGELIRSIVGPHAQLLTCNMVLDQPELFYYSGVPTHAYDGTMLDWRKLGDADHWVVLDDAEMTKWHNELPPRSMSVFPFVANRNKGYLVWYSPARHPAPSSRAVPGL
jgi:4-amino-4-deoxy-L-arabinose transferase-like glycosyltransferase